MSGRALLVLSILAVCVGCRSNMPGYLAAASVRAIDMPLTVVATEAEGRSCGNDTQRNIPAAIEHALAQNPPANAILNISMFKEPRCIRITGVAVQIPPQRSP